MKNAYLALAVLGVFFLADCVGTGGFVEDSQGAEDIVMASFDKVSNYPNVESSGSITISMSGMGALPSGMSMEGTMDMYKQGNDVRIDIVIEVLGVTTEQRIYILDGQNYQCIKGMSGFDSEVGEWTCLGGTEANATTLFGGGLSFNPEQNRQQLQQMISAGAVTFIGHEKKTVAGRACDAVQMNIDISKVLSIIGYPEDTPTQAFKSYALSQCIDEQTGYSLSSLITMEIEIEDQLGIMKMSTIVDSFNPNPTFDTSIFELPAEPESTPPF